MPRRRDERNRVLGPTWLPSSGYWRITVITPSAPDPKDRSTAQYYREEDEAIEVADKLRARINRLTATTLETAIERYDAFLTEKGTGEISRNETRRRLRVFFPDLDK